jgi:aspartate kinase
MSQDINQNKLLVMKFGGTSVKNTKRIGIVADKITAEISRGNNICVVVSAMAGMTNTLVEYCNDIGSTNKSAEYDTVLAAGEQITAGLLSIALGKRGIDARSWLGWQVPISCDNQHGKSRIQDIPSSDFRESVHNGQVAVVAGFQGVSNQGRITTLGRGGSDTTAVALAAALNAKRCDIYTDVDGLYTADPRVVPEARKIDHAIYEEVLEMASLGAKVLHPRCVELGLKENMPIQVLSSYNDSVIGSDLAGTLIEKEKNNMEHAIVNGIAHSESEAQITLIDVIDKPGVIAAIITPLADANVVIDTIAQTASNDGRTNITFSLPEDDLFAAVESLEQAGFNNIIENADVAKVSAVGIGMRSQSGVAKTFFDAMHNANVNIKVISTSDIKISVLIARQEYA